MLLFETEESGACPDGAMEGMISIYSGNAVLSNALGSNNGVLFTSTSPLRGGAPQLRGEGGVQPMVGGSSQHPRCPGRGN